MRKILLGAAAFSLLFAASCKKSDDKGSALGTWTLNSTTYSASETDTAVSGNNSFGATDAAGNSIYFNFNTPPVTGAYRVVAMPGLATISTNVVYVQATTVAGTGLYGSTGSDSISASVTVNNGKIAVVLPSVWVKNANGPDSTKLTATINQK